VGENFLKKWQYCALCCWENNWLNTPLFFWEIFSQKVNFWIKILVFHGRNSLKKSTFGSASSCFEREIFWKSQLSSQIRLVLWEKFYQKVIFWIKLFLFRGRSFLKKPKYCALCCWENNWINTPLFFKENFSEKVNFWVKFLLFHGRNSLKKLTFGSKSSCFLGEIFWKSQLLSEILLVSWEKFSQKANFWVKFFLFRGRNFLKKSTFESSSSCFVGEMFWKSRNIVLYVVGKMTE